MSLRTMRAGVALVFMLALPAAAQEGGRYQLERGEAGFVRLDTATGQMSLCREEQGELRCEAAQDGLADLDQALSNMVAERDRLLAENEALRIELDDYYHHPIEGFPSDEEIEEVANWFERVLVIMARTMRRAEEEIEEELERDRDDDL